MEEKNDIFEQLKPRKTSIPDDSYFEAMANSVIESQKKTPIVPLYKRPIVWIGAVAAVFLVGFLIVNFSSTSDSNSDALLALNDVSSNELFEYIDENIDDFDTDLIVDAMNESSVDEMNFIEPEAPETIETVETTSKKTTPSRITFDDIDANDILDYFNEEGIDSEDFEDDDSFI